MTMKKLLPVLLLLISFSLHAQVPGLVWASTFGSVLEDYTNAVTVDASGNVYTTGYFSGSADFDPGPGTVNLVSAGGTDIFISKTDSAGNLIWAKSIGSAGSQLGTDIVLDASGNIYVTAGSMVRWISIREQERPT